MCVQIADTKSNIQHHLKNTKNSSLVKKLGQATKTTTSKEFQALKNSIEKQLVHKFNTFGNSYELKNLKSAPIKQVNEKNIEETFTLPILPTNDMVMKKSVTSTSNLRCGGKSLKSKSNRNVTGNDSSELTDSNMSSFSSYVSIDKLQIQQLIRKSVESIPSPPLPLSLPPPAPPLPAFFWTQSIAKSDKNQTCSGSNRLGASTSIETLNSTTSSCSLNKNPHPLFRSTEDLDKSKTSKIQRNRIILQEILQSAKIPLIDDTLTTPTSTIEAPQTPAATSKLNIELISDCSISSSIPTLPQSTSTSSLLASSQITSSLSSISSFSLVKAQVVAGNKTDGHKFKYDEAEKINPSTRPHIAYFKGKKTEKLTSSSALNQTGQMRTLSAHGDSNCVFKKAKRVRLKRTRDVPTDYSEIVHYEDLFSTEDDTTRNSSFFLKINSKFSNLVNNSNCDLFEQRIVNEEAENRILNIKKENSTLSELSDLSQTCEPTDRYYENENFLYYENEEKLQNKIDSANTTSNMHRITTIASLSNESKNNSINNNSIGFYSSIFYPTILHYGEQVLKRMPPNCVKMTSKEEDYVNNLIMNHMVKNATMTHINNQEQKTFLTGQDETLRDAENMSDIDQYDIDQWVDIGNYYESSPQIESDNENANKVVIYDSHNNNNAIMPARDDSSRCININNPNEKSLNEKIDERDRSNKIRMIDNQRINFMKNVSKRNLKNLDKIKNNNQGEDGLVKEEARISQLFFFNNKDNNNIEKSEKNSSRNSSQQRKNEVYEVNDGGGVGRVGVNSIDLEKLYYFRNKIEKKSLKFLKYGDTSLPLMRISENNNKNKKNENKDNTRKVYAIEEIQGENNNNKKCKILSLQSSTSLLPLVSLLSDSKHTTTNNREKILQIKIGKSNNNCTNNYESRNSKSQIEISSKRIKTNMDTNITSDINAIVFSDNERVLVDEHMQQAVLIDNNDISKKTQFVENRFRAHSIDSLELGEHDEEFTVECKHFTIDAHNSEYDIDVDINVSKIEEITKQAIKMG